MVKCAEQAGLARSVAADEDVERFGVQFDSFRAEGAEIANGQVFDEDGVSPGVGLAVYGRNPGLTALATAVQSGQSSAVIASLWFPN